LIQNYNKNKELLEEKEKDKLAYKKAQLLKK